MRRLFSLRRYDRDDRGAVLAVVVLSIVALITMSSIAIDLGRQMLRRREAQAVADVVALDLVRFIDGRSEAEILADPDWATTISAAAARNNYPVGRLTVALGTYNAHSDNFIDTPGPIAPDSVMVTAVDTIDFFFGRIVGVNTGSVTRDAIASRTAVGRFSIGSFAASISPGNGDLLDALLDDALDVSLVSYEGLAVADVTLGELAAQLGFTTPQELLTSSVTYDDFILATADALRLQGDTVNATLLETIVANSTINGAFVLSDIISTSIPGSQSVLDASFNVLDLVAATAFLANGSTGLGVPTISTNIGLSPLLTVLALNGSTAIVQQPTMSLWGGVGTSAENSQIDVSVTGTAANVRILGGLIPVNVGVDIALDLSIANATGTITALSCGNPQALDVSVLSGLVDIDLEVGITVPLLGRIPLHVTSTQPATSDTASFQLPPDVVGDKEETGSGSIGLTGLSVTGGGLLGALLAPVTDLILTPLIDAIDAQLLGPLSDLLGVNVGGADVFLQGIDCKPPDLLR